MPGAQRLVTFSFLPPAGWSASTATELAMGVRVCVLLCYVCICVGGRWWDGAWAPVGIQRQTDVYLPSPYSSTGTLMTPALVYIRLLDSRVQYPRLDNIVFSSGWWCITKIRNGVTDVSRGKNNKSRRLVTWLRNVRPQTHPHPRNTSVIHLLSLFRLSSKPGERKWDRETGGKKRFVCI